MSKDEGDDLWRGVPEFSRHVEPRPAGYVPRLLPQGITEFVLSEPMLVKVGEGTWIDPRMVTAVTEEQYSNGWSARVYVGEKSFIISGSRSDDIAALINGEPA